MKESLPVAILAGGLATRLGPVTKNIPKSLIPIHGKPFLAYQLELLRSRGIQNVVLCVGHFGSMIEEAFGDGNLWGVNISYSYDGATALGTGGALSGALPLLGSAFFVLYGDSYLPIDFSEVQQSFERSRKPALMTVYANAGKWDHSNVRFDGNRIEIYDKHHAAESMKHIDYGLSIVTAQALKEFSDAPKFDLADLFSRLTHNNQLAGHEVFQRFYEIGSLQGLTAFENFIASMDRQPT